MRSTCAHVHEFAAGIENCHSIVREKCGSYNLDGASSHISLFNVSTVDYGINGIQCSFGQYTKYIVTQPYLNCD